MSKMKPYGQIGITEAQIDMLGVAENFCREKSPIDKVRAQMETELGYDADVWKEMGALGWLGVAVPEEFGGVGLSLTEVTPVAEQLGRYMLSTPFASTTLAAQALIVGGAKSQKSEVLPQIANGRAATLALSEHNGDWELENIETTAAQDKAGYRLTGTKTFVMNLMSAHWVIISAMLEGKPALFCVSKSELPNDNIRRETLVDETKRSYELTLEELLVGAETLMELDKASVTLKHIHLAANLLSAAELTGGCQSCIDYTVEYLKTRKQFGKLIGSYQALKHPTVDAFVDYQKSRSLLYAAAYSFDTQDITVGVGEIAVRMAKAQADKAMSFAADRSIQFHGGFGFTYDCDAQLYRRRAIFNASQYGDARYHKGKLAELLF